MNTSKKLEKAVLYFVDHKNWDWTIMCSHDAVPRIALRVLADCGLLEARTHPLGGNVWKFKGKLYGRTDNMTIRKFNKLKW